jgi:signal transduction histidine kinase
MLKHPIQPHPDQDLCPVTGFPIIRRPHWTDVELVEGYTATYCIIGDCILLTAPAGNAGMHGVPRFFEVRHQVLREGGLWDRDYVEIKDYARIDPGHSRLGRMQFVQGMLAEGRRGRLKGFWGFNGSFLFRCIMKVAKRLIRHDGIPFTFVRDYETAMHRAVELMRDPVQASGWVFSIVAPIEPPDLEFIGESNRFRMPHTRAAPGPAATGGEPTYSADEIGDLVNELLRFMGTVNWNIEGVESIHPDPSNPLHILYEAVAVLKQDFDTILREKEEMQGTLVQAEKLASLGTLTAGFAHQLNNPLTAVLGFAQRIARRSTDARSRDDAAVIVRAGSRMRALVDQLCQLNREQFFYEKKLIDVNDVIGQALVTFEKPHNQPDISIETDLSPGLPLVLGHAAHFEGLFINLLENARQAHARQADARQADARQAHARQADARQAHARQADARDRRIRICTSRSDGSVRIVFFDNACGMPDRVRACAFEPFFSTSSTGQNVGLGLFIAHQIVKEHGGEIRLQSEEGASTTVEILFPLPSERSREDG